MFYRILMNHIGWQTVRISKQKYICTFAGLLESNGGGWRPGGESEKRWEQKTEGEVCSSTATSHILYQIKMRSKRDAGVKGKHGVMYINLDGGGGEIQSKWLEIQQTEPPSAFSLIWSKHLKQQWSCLLFRRGAVSFHSGFKRSVSLPDGFPFHGSLHFQVNNLIWCSFYWFPFLYGVKQQREQFYQTKPVAHLQHRCQHCQQPEQQQQQPEWQQLELCEPAEQQPQHEPEHHQPVEYWPPTTGTGEKKKIRH